jgi:hypothetical protein
LPRWYRLWPRLARFKPIQDTPPRDPRFKVIRAEGQDALASVRAETEREKAEAARAQAAKEAIESEGIWIVKDPETGELEKVDGTAVTQSAQARKQSETPVTDEGGLFQ